MTFHSLSFDVLSFTVLELDWIDDFVQKKAAQEVMDKIKVNINYHHMILYVSLRDLSEFCWERPQWVGFDYSLANILEFMPEN